MGEAAESPPTTTPAGRPRQKLPWLALGALLAVGWLALEGFTASSWHFNRTYNPPLDDTYIYYQYAKQLARGQLYRYQDGEPASTGSTSMIYPVLLAPFWLAGLRGPALFWGGYVVNLGGLLLAVLSMFLALRRLLPHDRVLPFLGGLLTIGNGWFLWGVASGMDTGVLAGSLALALHAAIRFCAEREGQQQGGPAARVRLLAFSLALLALSRPEGLVLSWTITLALWLWLWLWLLDGRGPDHPRGLLARVRRELGRAFSREARPPLALLAALVLGTAPTFLLALASGHLSTSGMALKSHFAFEIGTPRYLDVTSRTMISFLDRLLWTPTAWLRGLLVLAVLAGIAGLWRGPSGATGSEDSRTVPRGPGLILGGAMLALFLFYGFLMAATEQHNRYYMAFTPLCALLAVVGVDTLAGGLRGPLQAPLRRTLALALVLVGLGSIPHWAKEYAHNCRDLADQHLKMAAWIDGNLPADARLAINDAGAIAYLGKRRVIDLLGLTTNAMRPVGHWREEGHMWEVMERMRPTHLVVYPSFFDDLHRLPVMRKIHSINLGRDSLLGDREKIVYAIDWPRALPPGRPHHLPREQAGWKLVDAVDVADTESERAHGYRVRYRRVTGADRFRLRTFAVPGGQVIDGGRLHDGPERFGLEGIPPGQPNLLGLRSDFPLELTLEVRAGGVRRPWISGTPAQRQPREAYLLLPAEAAREPRLDLEVVPLGAVKRGSGLASFHYFALQPR
jgi:hypothetical protein